MRADKILFLDIDGVLDSRRSVLAFNGYPRPGSDEKFDPVAVALIRRLCNNGVKIVLSSSWRIGQRETYKSILGLPIIGRTPCLEGVRGREIAQWLSSHEKPKKWAILDDDSDMLDEQMSHFVHVDASNGLLLQDYELLCHILDVPK